jgi:hypothetical protein
VNKRLALFCLFAAPLGAACGGKTVSSGGAGGGTGAGSSTGGGFTVGGNPTAGGQGGAVGGGGFGVGGGPGGGREVGVMYCDPFRNYPGPIPVTGPLISDFETGPVVQAVQPGGVWIVESDGRGFTSMTLDSCGVHGTGLHFVGKGHDTWGADVSAFLVSETQPVDVSAYSGVGFVIKAAFATNMILKVENPYSQPACGKCDDTIIGAECQSGYMKNVSLPAFSLPQPVSWSELAQQGWGYKAPGTAVFDPRNLVKLMFAFDKGVDFDVCIDDVGFF